MRGVSEQLSFLQPEPPALPSGFVYRPEFVSAAEESALAHALAAVEVKPFEFQGWLGARRVAYFGRRYDFNGGGLGPAEPIPDFLQPLRARCAGLLGAPVERLEHALVTEYAPGAPIGWHRDRPAFDQIVGVSLLGPATLRFRRRRPGGFDRANLTLEPRSAYTLAGEARSGWEHSIPPVEALRWSVTFRTLR